VYFGFLGGSALLHLLAAHPKVVAVFGIATTVGMLATSMGPQNYLGSGQQMRRIEQTVTANQLVDDEVVKDAVARGSLMAATPTVEVESIVRQVLRKCGNGCASLTPAIVMDDAELLRSALTVAELERHSAESRPVTSDRIAQLMARQ